jgi:toxin-antitoxin system PIN domain toxin
LIAVDTNVLVYAHRRESPEHKRALAWVRHLAEGPAPWAIPVFCLVEFVRVVTHPRVFDPPSTFGVALDALRGLLASPSVRVVSPGPRYPELFDRCVRDAEAKGNLAFDAQIAALCREHGIRELLTGDRDFSRFPHIKILALTQEPRA